MPHHVALRPRAWTCMNQSQAFRMSPAFLRSGFGRIPKQSGERKAVLVSRNFLFKMPALELKVRFDVSNLEFL